MGSRFCLYGYAVENNKYIINENEARIVSEIFEKYLSGMTLKMIADELTERKIPYYKEKNTWNKNMVARIIENAHYIGDEEYPKIVDEDIFSRAFDKKKSKGGTREKDTKEIKFLKTHTYCSSCGQRYIRKMITHTKREKWFCENLCKTRKYIDDKAMFRSVLWLLNFVIENPGFIEHRTTEAKSYIPDLDVMKKENELGYFVEQKTKDFQMLADEVLSIASLKFDCCSEFADAEYTKAFKEYLESQGYIDKLDYQLLFDIVDKIMINAKGDISIRFVNNTVLSYREGECINVAS